MDREIGIYEAKNRLSALVEEVAQGKRIWITRRGRRVAQLSSGIEAENDSTAELIETFRHIRAGVKPGDESIKELVELGRK